MKACNIEKKWRRGQDSNLHILSDGGFQDRCTTIMRPLRNLSLKLYRRLSYGLNRNPPQSCQKPERKRGQLRNLSSPPCKFVSPSRSSVVFSVRSPSVS